MNDYKLLNGDLTKFCLTKEQELFLHNEDKLILKEIGIPNKILSNTFILNESLSIENNFMLLGSNTHVPEWKLSLSIDSRSVSYQGKGKNSDQVYAFYNSTLKQLLLSLMSYNFFMRRLIITGALGDYHTCHEKYANLLYELILDIDEQATKTGVWNTLIEEMRMGVI